MRFIDVQITPDLEGLIAVPEQAKLRPLPGVVMVHEVFGINDVMRAQMTRLAEAGYVVIMPNLSVAVAPASVLRPLSRIGCGAWSGFRRY
jgi:carboxymethylenebutenolidase